MTGSEVMRQFEKAVMLSILDQQWKEHLASMDYLRRGINLRSFAQKKPQQEYKREGFEMFTEMLDSMKHEVMKVLARVKIRDQDDVSARRCPVASAKHRCNSSMPRRKPPVARQPVASRARRLVRANPEPFVRDGRKVGRNEPCPCGSGKKYKQCHGKLGWIEEGVRVQDSGFRGGADTIVVAAGVIRDAV